VKHAGSGRLESHTITGITNTVYGIDTRAWKLGPGDHTLRVVNIKNGYGCSQDLTRTEKDSSVALTVARPPNVTAINYRQDICVGDRITFTLMGLSPFAVEYSFDGSSHIASTSHEFSRVAEKPGRFLLHSIRDSMNQCQVNINGYPVEVHEMPSARINEGVDNIHEGDQAKILFQLDGTPPWTFTYSKRLHGKVVDTTTITRVYDAQYELLVSSEGTYEVISVEDQFCRFPKSRAALRPSKQLHD